MNQFQIDGQDFVRLLSGGASCLRENQSIVNDLNVFPIPDGDTGSNMLLTMEGGVNSSKNLEESRLGKVAATVASGMLLSARGNSGVILSQLFAGIAKGLEGKDTATAREMAVAMQSGVQTGYNAVVNPTEGTILTVDREAASFAESRVTPDTTIEGFFNDYFKEAEQSSAAHP
jgi:dihydroxyacetone kinase-like predicted kinase